MNFVRALGRIGHFLLFFYRLRLIIFEMLSVALEMLLEMPDIKLFCTPDFALGAD